MIGMMSLVWKMVGKHGLLVQKLELEAAGKAAQGGGDDASPVALLELAVFEAANLPTDEWTRAFCIIKLTPAGGRGGGRGAVPVGAGLAPEDPVATYEMSETGLSWQSVSGLVAHRTEVVEGIDPVFGQEFFRFPVADPSEQQVRVQVLHKGFMATEFVGEILLHVEDILHLIQAQGRGDGDDAEGGEVGGGGGVSGTSSAQEDAADAASSWFPLRTATGGRVRNRLGSDSELRMGFRWIQPPPPHLVVMRGDLHRLHGSSLRDEAASPAAGGGGGLTRVGGKESVRDRAAAGEAASKGAEDLVGGGDGRQWLQRAFTLDPYTQVP
jgi:hypothetical protein